MKILLNAIFQINETPRCYIKLNLYPCRRAVGCSTERGDQEHS